MFKKSTVFISPSIRRRLQCPETRVKLGSHKGLWLAIGLAYDLLRLGTLGAFTGKWVAEDSQNDDCIHTHQYNRKYFDGWHCENNSLRAALRQANRIEAHVRDAHPDAVETKFSFYDGSKKEPFMELTAAFDREGKGGIYHQRGFPEMRNG